MICHVGKSALFNNIKLFYADQDRFYIPEFEIEEVINEIRLIFEQIKSKNEKVDKLVFLGDITHLFSYEWQEKRLFKG